MKTLAAILILSALGMTQEAPVQPKQCLLVSFDGGHRMMGYFVAGAAGALLSGGKYRYLDAVNMKDIKMTYKGKDLEKLQKDGVHVVIMNRDAGAEAIKDARTSCAAN